MTSRILIALGLVGMLVGGAFAMVPSGTVQTASAKEAVCPITMPNGVTGPGFEMPGAYGNEALITNLFMWSNGPVVVVPNDDRIDAAGVVHDMKWAWYRVAKGNLTIYGERLDANADRLSAWIPEGYGNSGFQVAGLTFPTGGCWEITGVVDGKSLTFVTYVLLP